MDALKKGQLIGVVCLAITIAIVAFLSGRMVGPRDLALLALIICAISIMLSHLIPKRDRHLQKFTLFLSVAIACVAVGTLLLQMTMLAAGLVLVVASFLPGLLAIRLLVRKVRKPNAP